MAYPASNDPITEFLINGVWTDIHATNNIRSSQGGGQDITITRGRSSGQGTTSPQTSIFTIDNRGGQFSNRNPNSPYFGLLPLNTQIRHRAGDGDNYLFIPWNDQIGFNGSGSADKASFDIVGDTEVRIDCWPHSWRPPAAPGALFGSTVVLASKWTSSSANRSWVLYLLSNGCLGFSWSTDGTAILTATSPVSVPVASQRLSVKVTMDVDNGAAGNTVTFSTASTINGTYTVLGSPVVTGGITSIFSSTANLYVGIASGGNPEIFTNGFTFGGRVYELQLRNGIGGALVANPIYGSAALGATIFVDSLGNNWTQLFKSRIISDRMRYVGELSSPVVQSDLTHKDVSVSVSSAGLMERLSTTGQTLGSAMTRQFSTLTSSGYWPLEDGATSQTSSSPIVGVAPAVLYSVTMDATSDMKGTSSAASFGDSTTGSQIIFTPKRVTATPSLFLMFYVKCNAVPAAAKVMGSFYATGTVRRVDVSLSTAGWTFDFIASDSTSLASTTIGFGTNLSPITRTMGLNILMTESAGTISWYVRWLGFGDTGFIGIGPTNFAGTTGIWTQARITAKNATEFQGMTVSHVFLSSADVGFVSSDVLNAVSAYNGELAGYRIDRLGREQNVATEIIGQWNRTAKMGYQTNNTFINLVQECADVDRGILGESRSMNAITYRCAMDIETRRDLTLDYSASHLSEFPLPSPDSTGFANDITMVRTNGSSARKQIATAGYHQVSIQDPPLGSGAVQGGSTVPAYLDSQMPDIASWKAHVASWDEDRFPNVKVSLHRSEVGTTLAEQVRAIDMGDTATLAHMPSFMPPDDVQLLIQGTVETLRYRLWDITFNTTQGGPYRTGRYDQADLAGLARYTTNGSTVSTAVNTVVTTLILAYSTVGDNWTTTPGSYPFDIMIEGERITLTTAPAGTASPQTFTGVTRSVNGIIKAHGVGAVVELFDTCYYSL